MKIQASNGCTIKSAYPSFRYKFKSGEIKDIPDEHTSKILKNSNFSKSEGNTSPSDLKKKGDKK